MSEIEFNAAILAGLFLLALATAFLVSLIIRFRRALNGLLPDLESQAKAAQSKLCKSQSMKSDRVVSPIPMTDAFLETAGSFWTNLDFAKRRTHFQNHFWLVEAVLARLKGSISQTEDSTAKVAGALGLLAALRSLNGEFRTPFGARAEQLIESTILRYDDEDALRWDSAGRAPESLCTDLFEELYGHKPSHAQLSVLLHIELNDLRKVFDQPSESAGGDSTEIAGGKTDSKKTERFTEDVMAYASLTKLLSETDLEVPPSQSSDPGRSPHTHGRSRSMNRRPAESTAVPSR